MKKIIELDEYKKILLKMLKFLDDICEKNNINYSLDAGSLIGAVREGGIIPWDDDIDLIFEPCELKRLIECINSDKNSKYRVVTNENNKSYYYPFPKLIDTSTIVYEKNIKKIDDYGVYIDLFQYNNLPKNKLLSNIYIARIKYLEQLIKGYAQLESNSILKKIRNMYCNMVGIEKILSKYSNFSTKYNNKKTCNVITNWPIYRIKNEIQNSSYIHKYINIDFDGTNAKIFKEYDKLLSKRFGNYMKRPPVEKQIAKHEIEAYYK